MVMQRSVQKHLVVDSSKFKKGASRALRCHRRLQLSYCRSAFTLGLRQTDNEAPNKPRERELSDIFRPKRANFTAVWPESRQNAPAATPFLRSLMKDFQQYEGKIG